MRKATLITLAGCLGLLATTPAVWAGNGVSNGGPSINTQFPSNQQLLYVSKGDCQNCWTGGVTLRGTGSVTGPGAAGTINVPANVVANAVYAELFWVTLDSNLPAATETFNGNGLARVANGPVTASPCWPQTSAFSWRANVLGLLVAGNNSLANFPDDGQINVGPATEGATLVIVYQTDTIDKDIYVLGGNDLTLGAGEQFDLALPVTSADGFGAELHFIVGDGQVAPDQAFWNGLSLAGTDAFLGLDPGPGVGYWDTLEFGVATQAPNTASILGTFPGDCLNWVGTVFCVKRGGCVVPVEPSTWGKIKSQIGQ